MQKITPFLWFDREAEEAMSFYVSVFENSRAGKVSRYAKGSPYPEGSVMSTSFNLEGLDFIALNGGPVFRFTQAISFYVSCKTLAGVDTLWRKLSEGGKVHMDLQKYPFSERFGWVEDRFGIGWQLNLTGAETVIAPFLLFVGEQSGKAEEAIELYTSLLKNSGIGRIERYGAGRGEKEGTVMHAKFSLENQEFMAMDSSGPHAFTFTPAISFFRRLPNAGGGRRSVEQVLREGQARAVRLADGPVRSIVANSSPGPERAAGRRRPGKGRPSDAGHAGNGQTRDRGPGESLLGGLKPSRVGRLDAGEGTGPRPRIRAIPEIFMRRQG